MYPLSTLTVKLLHNEMLREAQQSRLAAGLERRDTRMPLRFLQLIGLRPALAAR
jgi:hypothetical protein